ncbi:TBC1 domain family member 17 isoform X2 [Amia ocellicauda]|uniref:TBC1 domain family member 17 isoform X2 n=1 Tax=Amia ocellicauda TaxID=2972642 RepID=UPI003464C5E3
MEANGESHKVLFEKEGVFLHTNAKRNNQESTIPGTIRITERGGEPALEWSPLEEERGTAPQVVYSKKDGESEEETNFDPGYEPDWAVISTVKTCTPDRERGTEKGGWSSFSLPLSELSSLRRSRFSLGRNFLVLTSQGGAPLPPLHFHRGGTRELLAALQRYIILAPSPVDSRLFLVYPHDSGALSQSFDELQLFDDGTSDLVSGVELIPRPEVKRAEPLNKWEEYFDEEGQLQNPQQIKEFIFRGGIAPSLRKDVWKFLLGFYPWESTAKKREEILRRKTDEYFRMKVQWKSVSEEQEMRNSLLRGYRSLIERDVNRTDRNNRFFAGSDSPGLGLLHDVLMTYCMYNFDLGYVQGMSDLLSPILFVTQNEVESFWCLTGFMQLVHQNFEESQEAMKQQLLQLNILLRTLDPELCDFLDSQDSGSLCFTFRWLLIWFKREFSFEDILTLWEVMWTGLPCSNFHLLVACGILTSQRVALMGSDYDFNMILKHINDLSMQLDVSYVLCCAEGIYTQLSSSPDVSAKVREVLGLCPLPVQSGISERSSSSPLIQSESTTTTSSQLGAVTEVQHPPPTYP